MIPAYTSCSCHASAGQPATTQSMIVTPPPNRTDLLLAAFLRFMALPPPLAWNREDKHDVLRRDRGEPTLHQTQKWGQLTSNDGITHPFGLFVVELVSTHLQYPNTLRRWVAGVKHLLAYVLELTTTLGRAPQPTVDIDTPILTSISRMSSLSVARAFLTRRMVPGSPQKQS
jgi:hypothetical protein